MSLTFTCAGCGHEHAVESTEDDLPDLKVKRRRVERACRACGHQSAGLEAPETCPNEGCPEPDRGFGPAERVVTDAIEVPLCTDCQGAVDADTILDAVGD